MDFADAARIFVELMCSPAAAGFVLKISTTLEVLAFSGMPAAVEDVTLAGVDAVARTVCCACAGGWMDETDGAVRSGAGVLGGVGVANFASGKATLVETAGLEAAGRDSVGEVAGAWCSVGG